jgi:hypothetical protein
MADAEVQGILPRTVASSDYDLGNGTYDLVLALVQLHLVVKFGKSLGRGEPAGSKGSAESPAPEPESAAAEAP